MFRLEEYCSEDQHRSTGGIVRLVDVELPSQSLAVGHSRGQAETAIGGEAGGHRDVHPELGLVFLIEHDLGAAEWRPAERQARAAEFHPLGTPARLLRVELPVADVRRTTQVLLRDLGLQFRPSLAGGGARDASIGRTVLRLLPAAAAPRGVPVVGLAAGSDERAIELLGVRWELTPG